MDKGFITKKTSITKDDALLRRAMYEAFDGQCFYTGRKLDFNEFHIDHIKPISKGGENCIENYVLSCGYINRKKQDKYTDRFIELTTELNKLLFVDRVVDEYNNLLVNRDILDNMIDVTCFLKLKGFNNHQKRGSFVHAALRKLIPVRRNICKQNGVMSIKKSIFFDRQELEIFWNEYDWEKRNKT